MSRIRLARSLLPCTCRPQQPRFYATQPPPSPPDKLVLAARKLIASTSAAAASADNKIEAAKLTKTFEELSNALRDVTEGEELIESLHQLSEDPDEDLRAMAESDLPGASETLLSLRDALRAAIVPPAPTSSLSAIVELKAGIGGAEAALFTAELMKMYTKLAVRRGWRPKVVETVGIGIGTQNDAFKEALLEIEGEGAFGELKREAGVHRVQRVPATEKEGRMHGSTVAVIVLPVESGTPPDDDLFQQKDVKVEVMRSRGAGGQHVNKTESAIRLTHLPTGVTVSMQDSRSQHENRAKAYRVLRARLQDRKLQQEVLDRRSARLSQVKGADRSEKIRTYNFPQDRLTDHRVGVSVNGLDSIMEGGDTIDYVWRRLEEAESEEALDEILAGP
ncbi:peptide chain release factor 1 [Pseudohyphozyma bogoriensis]|nr:peptide chain release factor 1 [Pseudohyphozyma bogoriensis]